MLKAFDYLYVMFTPLGQHLDLKNQKLQDI